MCCLGGELPPQSREADSVDAEVELPIRCMPQAAIDYCTHLRLRRIDSPCFNATAELLSTQPHTARPTTPTQPMEHHIRLAQQLPPRLLNFFKKFPPPATTSATTTTQRTLPTIEIASNTSSTYPNIGATTEAISVDPTAGEVAHDDVRALVARNPFLPVRNPQTGNWRGPAYSLRRQADLFKLAVQHDVLSLMPLSPKHPEVREQKRIENGLRVQGTGVGKKVKGKLWERTLRGRLEERRRAMEGMPEMVRQWKERGHGRGWKKWPK